MRYIGLDLGTKTLGIAISDRLGMIASFYKTLEFKDEDYNNFYTDRYYDYERILLMKKK